jgi:hypothetical protein
MTRKDIAWVASRSLAMLTAMWLLVDLTYLPEQIFSLLHHLGHQSVVGPRDYWSSYYSLLLTSQVIRIILVAVAGVWFWKGGPLPERLFAGVVETGRIDTES